MKIHCFFEQSGTFKNVIKGMGGELKTTIFLMTMDRQTLYAICLTR